jgi:hypothetical protein
VTEGNADAAIVSGADVIVRDMVVNALCTGVPLSVTAAVNLVVPEALGIPVISPVGARLRPAGSVPDVSDHL